MTREPVRGPRARIIVPVHRAAHSGRRRTLISVAVACLAIVAALLTVSVTLRRGAADARNPHQQARVAQPRPDQQKTSATHSQIDCSRSRILVPSCGVLWGASVKDQRYSSISTLQRKLGAKLDIVYDFWGIDSSLPSGSERREVDDGLILHVDIAAREFGKPGKPTVSWNSIAAGHWDAQLTAQARGLASLPGKVFVAFDEEMDAAPKLHARGGASAFRAAYRHVHDVYERSGATNTIWVWTVTGSASRAHAWASLWPGNDYVDWISWDPFNGSQCYTGRPKVSAYRTFEQAMLPFYKWLKSDPSARAIDRSKPLMISETGTAVYPGQAELDVVWYQQMASTLQAYPAIKAVHLWSLSDPDSPGCDFDVGAISSITSAVAKMMRTPGLAGGR